MEQSTESNGWENPGPDEIRRIILEAKTIAMVGLSANEARASNEVARYLMKQGYRVIPVNPRESEILGEKSYPDITSIGEAVDIVDIFRKGEDTPPIVKEAIACKAACIWLQKGIVSQESYGLARQAGLPILMNICLLEQHKKLRS